MGKRSFSIVLGLALVASLFTVAPARGQGAPAVPAEPNIVDPPGDANYINNSNTGGQSGNNHVGPGDASSLADILAVWFSNDAENISIHVQTEAPQPSSGAAYIVFFYANADECLFAEFAVAAPSYQGESYSEVEDECAGLDPAAGEIASVEGPDGTGIITATFPRSYSASFADGAVITAPRIEMRNLNGGPVSLRGPTIDNTDPGTDYTIVGGGDTGVEPEPEPTEDPDEADQPKKKKKKKKGKKGKKGKNPGKPKPPVDECAAYVPGELGAEAETSIVTDEATEEAPIEIEVPLGPAGGAAGPYDTTTRMQHNVQIDSTGDEVGLYARLESPVTDDPDLYVYWSDGTEAARAAGFNLTPVGIFDGTGNGGHSEMGAEQIDGLRAADCQGWTLDLVNWLGQGGTYTLKLWLGEIQNDPAPPSGGGEEEALAAFWRLLTA